MRVVTYGGMSRGLRAGVVVNDRVADAWDGLHRYGPDQLRLDVSGAPTAGVRQLLPWLREAEAAAQAMPHDDTRPLDEVSLEVPVPDPEKIICIGLNYRPHAEEAGLDPPSEPTFFAKFRNALVPSGANVALPGSQKVDYEAEVAFIVGRYCRNVDPEDALDHLAGYTLLNDLSARDWQFATPQWMPGKVFDGSAPCGPALVTPDEVAHDSIDLEMRLNGETMQQASTADLIFSIPVLLAHLSRRMTLVPGDIVSTGTPAGVGSTREPRVWLKPGDEMVVSSPILGELTTRVVD